MLNLYKKNKSSYYHNHIYQDEKTDIEISNEFEEITNLSTNIEKLFELYDTNKTPTKISNSLEFNYNFKKELTNGYIEYKRTLKSYDLNGKIDKLFRQIYWRMYESFVINGLKKCYYIIGLEDSGNPSYISKNELEESVKLIETNINSFNVNFKYLFLKNTIEKYDIVIIKFWIENNSENEIEYF